MPAFEFTLISGSNIATGQLSVLIWELDPMTLWIQTKVKLEKLAGIKYYHFDYDYYPSSSA